MPTSRSSILWAIRWVAFCIGTFSALCGAEAFGPFKGPAPILVVLQTQPWGMVVEGETPAYVLYQNGLFVFQDHSAKDILRYRASQLPANDMESLLNLFRETVPVGGFKARYDLAPWKITDQPELRVFFRTKEQTMVTRLYAWTLEGPSITSSMVREMERLEPESSKSDRPEPVLPGQLGKVFNRLREVSGRPSQVWVPLYMEAVLWPFPHAKGKGMPWPTDLPQPGSKFVRVFPHRISAYVDQKDPEKLLRFFETTSYKFGRAVRREEIFHRGSVCLPK